MATESLVPSLRLPLELIYDIVDFLVQDQGQDILSIRACSLVCQAFVSKCQAALFSTLDIFLDEKRSLRGDKFPNQQTRKLSEVLQYKPYLASHFHTLRWGVSRSTINPTPSFLPILERIQGQNKIRTLQLYSRHRKQQNFSDARLLGRVITPFITRLEIANVHLYNAPDFFTTCRKLKELQVDKVSESNTFAMTGGRKFRPRLQLYDDKISHDTFDPAKVVDFSNLRVLRIYPGLSDKLTYLQSLFNMCAITVEELHFKKMEDLPCRIPLFLDFSFFPSLRVLDLDMDDDFPFGYSRPAKDPFPELDNALGTISTENKIEVLVLNLFLGVKAISELETTFDLHWEILTSQIRRISSGKPLRALLHISYYRSAPIADEEFLSLCKSVFQRLVLGNRLLISFPSHISLDITHNVLIL